MFLLAVKRDIIVTMRMHGTDRDEARWPDVAPVARVVRALWESASPL
jgi:hypothetical protein